MIQEEGSPGGPLFRAVNTIAEAIEDDFPYAMVQTLAYEWSRFPPRTRPRKNVIIELCDIEEAFDCIDTVRKDGDCSYVQVDNGKVEEEEEEEEEGMFEGGTRLN